MERAAWLQQMRSMAEALYDHISPAYWVQYGKVVEETRLPWIQQFLTRLAPGSILLSAGCGAGLYEGLLLEAGHGVMGIDQSEGMLARARQHNPQVRYTKMGFQEMAITAQFDGLLCMDALEHVCPEDYQVALHKFQQALKPGGVLYFTVDNTPSEDLELAYQKAKALGLPVVPGELVDQLDESFAQVMAADHTLEGDVEDAAVYHFYPSLDQVRGWLGRAGLAVEVEGDADGYHHIVARKLSR